MVLNLVSIIAYLLWFVNVYRLLEVEVGVGIENMDGDFLHQAAHEFENHQAGGNNNQHYDNVAGGEEDKLKEVADKRNGKGGGHNTNDSDEEASTEFVEWTRNPIDENKVDSKGNKDRDSSKLWVRKALKVRNNGKRSHAKRNRETNWEGIGAMTIHRQANATRIRPIRASRLSRMARQNRDDVSDMAANMASGIRPAKTS